jgi:protein-tyrosine kinase
MVALEQGPDASIGRRYAFSSDVVCLHDNRPVEAEAIRTIRTHVIARHVADGRRGLAVCGPRAGVGCTFTAVNLAVAMSQVGVSTLLIDSDLREPGVPSFIWPEDAGTAPAVSPDGPRGAPIQYDVLPNLSLLSAEDAARSGDELLGGSGFRQLIERCLRDFEFTIVDTPPANVSSDALRVSSVVGYSLVVARTNVSLLKDVERLAKDLQEDGARVIGSVLNQA